MSATPPRWDLSFLYKSIDDPAIDADLAAAELRAKRFERRGRGGIANMTPADFGKMLIDYDRLNADIEKVDAFACMRYSVATDSDDVAAFYEKTTEKTQKIYDKIGFFESEIADMPEEKLSRLTTTPQARRFAFWIERTRAQKRPTPTAAQAKKLDRADGDARRALRLYDKTCGGIGFELNGERVTADTLYALSYSADAGDRLKAGLALNDGYKSRGDVFAKIVTTVARAKQVSDDLSGFKSPVEERNRSNGVENGVVDALVSSVDDSAPDVAHRFYALKAKWLGRDKIGYWDRNAPVAGVEPRRYTFDEAKDIVLSAYRGFDSEMGDIAQAFFDEKRIDAEPRAGKEGGEYAQPVANGKACIKMNFNGTTNDVLALAHELGHGIHYELAKKNDSLGMNMPVTMEETASIFGETLAFNQMLKNETDPKRRFALLSDKMTRVMLTTFRQVALHHYETDVHDAVRKQGKVDARDLNGIWTKTQRAMLGPAVENDDRTSSSWADVPHLLRTPFYVYGYAFGECLTASLYKTYEDGAVKDFPKKYKEMLSKGSTEHYSKLLEPFGLDTSKPDFWKQGLGMMKGYVDKLELLTGTLGMDRTKTSPVLLKQAKSAGR